MKLTAKSVIAGKFYIVESKTVGKVGTVKCADGVAEFYNSIEETTTTYTFEEFAQQFKVNDIDRNVKTDEVECFGYPTGYSEIFNDRMEKKLPVFTKTAKSDIEYVGGFYAFLYPNNGWTRAYVPKRKTLDDYPWMGPYKTESDMLLAIRRAKADE